MGRLGYIHKDPVTEKYRLGLKFAEAARKATYDGRIVSLARPCLEQLRDQFDETVNLAVLQNGQIFYLEVMESRHRFRLTPPVGSRASVHSTALGKSIAAFLPPETLRAMLARYKFVPLNPHDQQPASVHQMP